MKRLLQLALLLPLTMAALPCKAQVSTYLDSFTWNQADAATTTYARTGYGFKPKLAFVWTNGNASSVDNITVLDEESKYIDTTTIYIRQSFGWLALESTGPDVITRRALVTTSGHWERTGGRSFRREDCVAANLLGSSISAALDISSLDADGITFIVDDQLETGADAGNIRVFVLAIGGADITNVKTGTDRSPASPGTTSVSAGFQPDIVFLFGADEDDSYSDPFTGLQQQMNSVNIGVGQDETHHFSVSMGDVDGMYYNQSASYGTHDDVLSGWAINDQDHLALRLGVQARKLVPTASGFDVAWQSSLTLMPISGQQGPEFDDRVRFAWLAVKGGSWRVGYGNTRTDASNFSFSGFGHQPKAFMVMSAMRPESRHIPTVSAQFSLGAAVSTSSRATAAIRIRDGSARSQNRASAVEYDALYANINLSTDTIDGLMDVVSFDADGVTLVMDDADPAANWFGFVSVGDN